MKIKNLTLQGFRGFNAKSDSLDFHESLTLIFGPNSYGKTSISEAFEWLLYGVTSKVQGAEALNNKTEYQGSYRNIHFDEGGIPFVEVIFYRKDNTEVTCRGELQKDDSIKKFIDGSGIDDWPWAAEAVSEPRPFVLQHSLKSLLLTNPSNRYKGVTRLIGAEELDKFQEDFVSLCTKYNKPKEVHFFLESINQLDKLITNLTKLSSITKIYKKKPLEIEKLYNAVASECASRLPKATESKDYLSALQTAKENAIKKVFDKNITLSSYSEIENKGIQSDLEYFASAITADFLKNYLELSVLSTMQHIINKSQFLDLGKQLLEKEPKTCPLTASSLPDECLNSYQAQCELIKKDKQEIESFQTKQEGIKTQIQNFKQRLATFHKRCIDKTSSFVELDDENTLSKIETLLGSDNQKEYDNLHNAIKDIGKSVTDLAESNQEANLRLTELQTSLENHTENEASGKALADSLIDYLKNERTNLESINKYVPLVAAADGKLKIILDKLADTQELTVLIKLLETRKGLEKRVKIQNTLDSLVDLKKQVDAYVVTKLENAVKTSLSSDVMDWYSEIKTQGDPDVHFEGFGFPQTKSGTTKARQIEVNAKSYDKRLPSAVSSLSESKLNALGLSMSIANCVKGGNTFSFILIDDPVQSLDEGHSDQVVGVIRKLAEDHQKQVILLSHDLGWINKVRRQCRTLNGYYYEIATYTQNGPNILRKPWAATNERFDEIKSWLNKPSGMSSKEKQMVANEFRLLYNELTAEIYRAKTGESRNPDKFNGAIIRDLLIKSDIPTTKVDQIDAAYSAVNAPHHQTSYGEPIEKLREYLKYADYMKTYLVSLQANAKLDKATKQLEKK
jgi:uncharacterized protein YoxC